jgi:hypothetical protein
MTALTLAAEGICDIRALERIARDSGFDIDRTYNCRGKTKLDKRLPGFLQAGIHAPWLVLRDLDEDAACAPVFLASRALAVPPQTIFRLAVRSLEAWLMADRKNFATWLGVSATLVDQQPEIIVRPKIAVSNLAARSNKRTIRERMAPRPENGASIGPEYEAALIDFIENHWNFRAAAATQRAPSLTRAVVAIQSLFQTLNS